MRATGDILGVVKIDSTVTELEAKNPELFDELLMQILPGLALTASYLLVE